jgi:Rrf2 family transcriptional regulator, iron-sulfur cluster assembly transcription factor
MDKHERQFNALSLSQPTHHTMFSKTTEYALRATIFIAKKSSPGKKLSIDEIADAIDSPQSFTAKVLQLLTKDNQVVSSVRGPGGGFYMTDAAKKLPARAILIAMDEEHILTKCVLGLKQCSETQPCPMHVQYKVIKQQLIKLFEGKTIGELASEMDSQQVVIRNFDIKEKQHAKKAKKKML